MTEQATVKKDDFVELLFTGKTNGTVFDSNIPEDLKTIAPDAKPRKTIVAVGHKMLLDMLDEAILGKEIGKEYSVHIPAAKGFGLRRKELVKTIPLKVFTEQKVNPQPGATFYLDNQMVKIIAVSGARVTTDFNNPLAGKDLDYAFTVKRIVTDEDEKIKAFLDYFLRAQPKYRVEGTKLILTGPVILEQFVNVFKKTADEILKKELAFELEKEPQAPTAN